MKYILMHREQSVAEIEIDTVTSAILKIGEIFAPERIPIGIGCINNQPNRGELNKWWSGRSIPASRQNFRDAMENLGVHSSGELLTKCFGLSLSDQYWVNPADNPLEWKHINFFDNPFSEDVGDVLFGENKDAENINLMSPDNTSDGWLKKKWKIIDGKRCLIKGGSTPILQEPFNEVASATVMRCLDIPHIGYSLIVEQDKPYSVCEDFITSETDLISAWYVASTQKKPNNVSHYQHFLNCCELLNIPDVQENLNKMLVVDYLIVNQDRHYNNFGVIRNAESLDFIGLAPVFDSGTSMWYDTLTENHFKNANIDSKPFRSTHEEQIKLVKDFSWLDLSTLKNIDEEIHEIFSQHDIISKPRQDKICRAFAERVKMLEKQIKELAPQKIFVESKQTESEVR